MIRKTSFLMLLTALLLPASFVYSIQGDMDVSGRVDGADLAIFAPSFGSSPVNPAWRASADIAADGSIDGNDLAVLASNFGQSAGSGSLAVNVTWGSRPLAKASAGGRLLAKAPASVAFVRLEVAGTDFTTKTADFAASAGGGSISGVPAGSNRTVKIYGMDALLNVLYQGSAIVSVVAGQITTVDIFAPSVTVTSTNIDPPSQFSGSGVPGGVYLNWSSVSAAVEYNIYFGAVPKAYSTYTTIPAGSNQFTLPITTTGDLYIYITAVDNLGNESWFSGEVRAPGLPTVVITSPAHGSFTNLSTPFLNYSVSGGTVVVKVDGNVVSKVSGDRLDSLADGSHTVTVKATDDAFNSYSTSVSFTVDTAVPTGSISIVGDYTNLDAATLWLNASDANGIFGYLIAEGNPTPPSVNDIRWINFTSYPVSIVKTFTFSKINETAFFYCWYKDEAGNISLTSQDSIIRDYVIPGDVSSGNSTALVRRVGLSWTNPGDADLHGVEIRRSTTGFPVDELDGIQVFTASTSLVTYVDNDGGNLLTVGTKYYYSLFAFDKAGNYAAGFKQISAYPFQTTPMVAAGAFHSIALHSDGSLYAWGDDAFGQLGDDATYANKLTANNPVNGSELGYEGVVSVAAGDAFNLALKSDGTVFSWGDNDLGQLGILQSISSLPLPVQVTSLSGIKDIAAGAYHAIAVKNDGTVWTTGANTSGQLGNGSDVYTFTNTFSQISGFNSAIVAVTAGVLHSMALDENGYVWAWGDNDSGQFGISSSLFTLSNKPFKVYSGITKIAAGGYHSLAMKNDGSLYLWGYNSQGQLGNNNAPVGSDSPVHINGFGGLGSVSVVGGLGDYHTLVVDSNGDVWTWGQNNFQQLGSSYITNNKVPNRVKDFETAPLNVISIEGGEFHTIVLDANGYIWTWGQNKDGQVGDGTFNNAKNTPYKIIDITLK